MTTAQMAVVGKPLSFKAACAGFVASTTALTVLMVLVSNFV